MRQVISFTLIIFWVLAMVVDSAAQNDRYFIPSPRALGMGGAGVAVLATDHVFFYNPAQLNRFKSGRLTILDLQMIFNQGLLKQIEFVQKHQAEFQEMKDFGDEATNKFLEEAMSLIQQRALAGFSGPFPLNIIGRNWGGGFFTRANVDYQFQQGASTIPAIDATVQADLLLIGAFAVGIQKPLPQRLSLGASVKYIDRFTTNILGPVAELNSNLVAYEGKALSFDMGALYSINRRWFVGATIYDLNSPKLDYHLDAEAKKDTNFFAIVPNGKIEPSLRLGTAYYSRWKITPFFRNITLAFDLDQPFDNQISFFKKLYFGIEGTLPFLQLRGGFAQGYPTWGLGLYLYILSLDYALYGEEWGRYAGHRVCWNHLVRVNFGL